MLRLTWKRKDKFQMGYVIGDPESIRDLYWQLTHNYEPMDGTEIKEILIHSMDGQEVNIKEFMQNPHSVVYPHVRFE